jgi:hypothetical protein
VWNVEGLFSSVVANLGVPIFRVNDFGKVCQMWSCDWMNREVGC